MAHGSSSMGELVTYTVGGHYVIQKYHSSIDNNNVRLLHHLPQINRCIVELPGGVELAVPPHVLVPKGVCVIVPAVPAVASNRTVSYLKLDELPDVISKVVFTEYEPRLPPKQIEVEPVKYQHTAVCLLKPAGYLDPESKLDTAPLTGLSSYQRTMVGAVVDRLRSPASSFFLAEGVGVGKTRILAGVIAMMDTPSQSDRHLWLSASDNVRGISTELATIKKGGLTLYPLGIEREIGPIQYGPGVVHCSYGQFASTSRRNGIRRLDAIVNWLKTRKGVVVLDDFSQTCIKPNVVTHLSELVESLQGAPIVYSSHMLYFQQSDLGLCRVLLQNTLNRQNVLVKTDTALALNHAGVLSCAFSDLKKLRITVRDVPIAPIIAQLIDQSYVLWAELWRTLCELQASGRVRPSVDDSDDDKGNEIAGGPKRAFWISHAEFFRSLNLIAKIPAIKDVVSVANAAGKKTVISLFHSAGEGRADSPKEILLRTIRSIFPDLNNYHLTRSAQLAAAALGMAPPPSARPKRKAPESAGRLPYTASFSRSHTKTDAFGVRIIESLDPIHARFSMCTNTAHFQPPKREFAQVKTKRVLYRIAPKLGPLIDVSDDSDAENISPPQPASFQPSPMYPPLQASSAAPKPPSVPIPGTVKADTPAVESQVEQQIKLGQSFVEKVNAMINLPAFSAVDLLVDSLGGSTVISEMTARKTHVLNKMYVRRSESENANQLIAFTSGNKKVAVVNDQSCIGFNLTSDINVIAEFPISPLRALQQVARGYTAANSTQADAVLLTGKLGGERFLACSVVESIEQFRTGGEAVRGRELLRPFYFDQMRAKLALDFIVAMCYNPSSYRGNIILKPNMGPFLQALGSLVEPLGWIPGVERRADSGTRFLQRVFGLPTETQEHVFAFVGSLMEQVR